MNRSLLIVGTAAAVTLGTAFAGSAIAQEFRGRGPMPMPPQMQQQMPQMRPNMQMPQGPQQHGPQATPNQGRGPVQPQAQVQTRQGPSAAGLFDAFDTNKDGTLTQDEINTARNDRLKQFDKNGDGKLSIEEYSALWLDAMHKDMVRQFQGHDVNGDGQVTTEEFDAPYKDAVRRLDRNGDAKLNADDRQRPAIQAAPQPQGPAQRPGQGPRRGAPTAAPITAPGALEAAPAGQAI